MIKIYYKNNVKLKKFIKSSNLLNNMFIVNLFNVEVAI